MAIHIIKGNPDEIRKQQLTDMYAKYLEDLTPYNNELRDMDYNKKAKERIAEFADSKATHIVQICSEQGLVGFAILGKYPNAYGNKDVYIEEFYIAEEYRRMGMGLEAMHQITTLYPSSDISLFVLKKNHPADRFWEATMNLLGYHDDAKSGRVSPPSTKDFDYPEEGLCFKYFVR